MKKILLLITLIGIFLSPLTSQEKASKPVKTKTFIKIPFPDKDEEVNKEPVTVVGPTSGAVLRPDPDEPEVKTVIMNPPAESKKIEIAVEEIQPITSKTLKTEPAKETKTTETKAAEVPVKEVKTAETKAAEIPVKEVKTAESKSSETPVKEVKSAEVKKTEVPAKEVKTIDSKIAKQESRLTDAEIYDQQIKENAAGRNNPRALLKKTEPPTPVKTAVEVTPVPVESKVVETTLPNSAKKGKKGEEKKDESEPPFERSRYYINRKDIPTGSAELGQAANTEGNKTSLARLDQIRLLALERKKTEAKLLIDGMENPELKFKGLFELAQGLENSSKGEKKLKEESIPYLLQIITEAPKENQILPKSIWAIAHLLYSIGDYTPALDHLSNIILNHKESVYYEPALYLSGRIYEESFEVRDLNRADRKSVV